MKQFRTFAAVMIGLGLSGLLLATPAKADTSTDQALERIERVLDDVEQIQRIMQDRPSERELARERLLRRQAELERERVHAMSYAARVSPRVVEKMRARGLSWGRIAHELRVSPFVVGIATGNYGERDYRRGHNHDDDRRFNTWHGKHKGMPPGQAKKMPRKEYRDDHRDDRPDYPHEGPRDDHDRRDGDRNEHGRGGHN